MTKKLVLLIPAVALLLFTVVFSAGCNFFGVNGEYYLYENNELNTDVYIKLSNGKWSSSGLEMSYSLFGGDDIEINSGTYQISNGLISFTSDYIPERLCLFHPTVSATAEDLNSVENRFIKKAGSAKA